MRLGKSIALLLAMTAIFGCFALAVLGAVQNTHLLETQKLIIEKQTEIVARQQQLAEAQDSYKADFEEFATKSNTGFVKQEKSVRNILSGLDHIDQVYGGLLVEQKKRAVNTLYSEEELIKCQRDGIALYESGKYAEAWKLLERVSSNQKDNYTAAFYAASSLFNINRQDKTKYAYIRSELERVRASGNQYEGLEETLSYIAGETEGIKGVGNK